MADMASETVVDLDIQDGMCLGCKDQSDSFYPVPKAKEPRYSGGTTINQSWAVFVAMCFLSWTAAKAHKLQERSGMSCTIKCEIVGSLSHGYAN